MLKGYISMYPTFLFVIFVQALNAGDELDDLLSAPRMVLTQFVDKWFPCNPDGDEPLPSGMNIKMLKRLLVDVSGTRSQCLGFGSAC